MSGAAQTIGAAVIVAVAVLFMLRRAWRTVRASRAPTMPGSTGCGPGCGCH